MKTARIWATEVYEQLRGHGNEPLGCIACLKSWAADIAHEGEARGHAAGIEAAAQAVEVFLRTDKYADPANIPSVIRALAKPESPAPVAVKCEHGRVVTGDGHTCKDCGFVSFNLVTWRKP